MKPQNVCKRVCASVCRFVCQESAYRRVRVGISRYKPVCITTLGICTYQITILGSNKSLALVSLKQVRVDVFALNPGVLWQTCLL